MRQTGTGGNPAPDGADNAESEHTQAASPGRAADAEASPGTDVAPTRVIRIDEPPASVTLSTSATETTIAVPHPRAESTVAVTPTPAADPRPLRAAGPHHGTAGAPPG